MRIRLPGLVVCGNINVFMSSFTDGAPGDLLPVQLELTSAQPDLNPDHNVAAVAVRVVRSLFLPMVMRRSLGAISVFVLTL